MFNLHPLCTILNWYISLKLCNLLGLSTGAYTYTLRTHTQPYTQIHEIKSFLFELSSYELESSFVRVVYLNLHIYIYMYIYM